MIFRAAVFDGEVVRVSVDRDSEDDDSGTWVDLPADFDPETQGAVTSDAGPDAGQVVVVSSEVARLTRLARRLRVLAFAPPTAQIRAVDFTLLGLAVDPWNFTRGARTYRDYRDPAMPERVVVRDRYAYEYARGLRDITHVVRTIYWVREDGTEGQDKDVSPRPNMKALKELNRGVRQGRIDFLEASADELLVMADMVPPEVAANYRAVAGAMGVLFDHYRNATIDYIARGTDALEQRVRDDQGGASGMQIAGILAVPTAPPSDVFPGGLTIGRSLIYQLTGYPE